MKQIEKWRRYGKIENKRGKIRSNYKRKAKHLNVLRFGKIDKYKKTKK